MSKQMLPAPPVEYCTELLASSTTKKQAARFRASVAIDAEEPVLDQIVALNRYWRRMLGMLSIDTISAREALIDECTYSEWKRLFARYVLPVVIEHRLPAE